MDSPLPFAALGLPETLARAFHELGFDKPTDVQALAMPLALARRDLLIESETGTGKTFAYLAPILAAALAAGSRAAGPAGIIAAPTQELAVQIGKEAKRLLRASGAEAEGFEVAVLLGGSPIARQEVLLKRKPVIVVGTLGRLADLAQARVLRTTGLAYLVLDEADRAFAKEMEELAIRLIEATPKTATRILASATLPKRTRDLAAPWLRDPALASVDANAVLSGDIEHWAFYCDSRKRADFLRRFDAALKPARCLLFHSNAARLGKLLETLEGLGLPVEAVSARVDKEGRRVALERFAEGELRYLLTSDLGARGLDIAGIDYVISLDLPEEPTVYTHRAGRTGRAGAKGVSIVLADGFELQRASRFAQRAGFVFRTKVLRDGKVFEPEVEEFFALVEEAEEKRATARERREAEPPSAGGRPARPGARDRHGERPAARGGAARGGKTTGQDEAAPRGRAATRGEAAPARRPARPDGAGRPARGPAASGQKAGPKAGPRRPPRP